jgi:hypothetical protein
MLTLPIMATYADYHIDDSFSTKVLKFTLIALSIGAALKKIIKIKNWKIFAIAHLNKQLNKIYIITEGFKTISEKAKKEEALKEYDRAQNALEKYRYFFEQLEKHNFFSHRKTRLIAENTLCNFYAIEANLRNVAFSDVTVPEDRELLEFASNLSMSSLSS